MLEGISTTFDKSSQGNGGGYHGNGYDQLDGDWATYYKVAQGFTHRVKREDREDFLHDLFLAFARVKASYDAKNKELTVGGLVRVAQHTIFLWVNSSSQISFCFIFTPVGRPQPLFSWLPT